MVWRAAWLCRRQRERKRPGESGLTEVVTVRQKPESAAGMLAVAPYSSSISRSAAWPGERNVLAGSGGLNAVSRFGGSPVGVLNGAQPGGYAGFAGGDGLAVAPTVGA